jgi:hypothetical protein
MPRLIYVALEGVLERLEAGPDGDLYTAHILTGSSTNELNGNQPVVLRKSVHGDLGGAAVRSTCRVVGGKIRPDGRLRADLSTVILSTADVPALKTR